MKKRLIGVLAVLIAGVPLWSADVAAGKEVQSIALQKARYYEQNADFHTIAFRELASIIEAAVGNYDNLLKCVEAVHSTMSNTTIIVGLASDISVHKESIPHFDDLLFVACGHGSNSMETAKYISAFVDGSIDYAEFSRLTRDSM